MSQWQSLCLALVVSLTPCSPAFSQVAANGPEIESGDVWSLPSDQTNASPIVVLPQAFLGNADVPSGDVWLSPDHQAISSNAGVDFHPAAAALADRNK